MGTALADARPSKTSQDVASPRFPRLRRALESERQRSRDLCIQLGLLAGQYAELSEELRRLRTIWAEDMAESHARAELAEAQLDRLIGELREAAMCLAAERSALASEQARVTLFRQALVLPWWARTRRRRLLAVADGAVAAT